MYEVLVNPLGGLNLPRKSVVRLTDRPDMTLDVYRGRKTTIQQQQSVCRPFPISPFVSMVSQLDSLNLIFIRTNIVAFWAGELNSFYLFFLLFIHFSFFHSKFVSQFSQKQYKLEYLNFVYVRKTTCCIEGMKSGPLHLFFLCS